MLCVGISVRDGSLGDGLIKNGEKARKGKLMVERTCKKSEIIIGIALQDNE